MARLGLAAMVATIAGLAGCDGCSPTSGGSTPTADSGAPNDSGPSNDSGSPESGTATVTVTPGAAKVLTCDTQQFQESGGAAGGAWSVSPASGSGTISSTGEYSAPLVMPASPGATIAYAAAGASASATVTLGTAFPGTPGTVPLNGSSTDYGWVPLAHMFAGAGSQVYAALTGAPDPASGEIVAMQVAASTNGGATFGQPITYDTGDLACASMAVDAGDPNVVYLVYSAGHGDSTTNTGSTVRLAVSTDGAKTFPVEYVVLDSQGNHTWGNCPDVASPSASSVVVTEVRVVQGQSAPTFWVGTYVSNNRGASIGPTDAEDGYYDAGASGSFISPSDTNGGAVTSDVISANGQLSPQIFTNGKGDACLLYVHDGSNAASVQCSSNGGTTWSAPAPVAPSTAQNSVPTGDISPGGNIAIAYQQVLSNPAGSIVTFVRISKDGGATWSSPVEYPLPSFADPSEPTLEAYLRWESDDVLWLSETVASVADPTVQILLVDKTCDFGQSWSGAVQAGANSPAALVLTGSGMAVGSYVASNAPGGPLAQFIPLAPVAP
ncbi:MAG TPA: hypothetical protein VIY73_05600 [Polyangiaceae bacterium]